MIIDPKKIIITKPEKGMNLRKAASFANLIFFWSLAIYLIRPLVNIFGWGIAYFAFDTVITDMGMEDIIVTLFTFYLPVILVSSLTLWLWARYNRFRFSGPNDKRRVPMKPLTVEQLSQGTSLPVPLLEKMQKARGVICHFDRNCDLCEADCFDTIDETNDALTAPEVEVTPSISTTPTPATSVSKATPTGKLARAH